MGSGVWGGTMRSWPALVVLLATSLSRACCQLVDWTEESPKIQTATGAQAGTGNAGTDLPPAAGEGPYQDDRFGTSIAVDGDMLIVGAENSMWWGMASLQMNGYTNDPNGCQGFANVFERQADGAWTQTAHLQPSRTGTNYRLFGHAVALAGGVALVSTPFGATGGSGLVTAFEKQLDGSWLETDTLMTGDYQCGEQNPPCVEGQHTERPYMHFGMAMDMEQADDGTYRAVISAPGTTGGNNGWRIGNHGFGMVYVWERRADATWELVQRLSQVNPPWEPPMWPPSQAGNEDWGTRCSYPPCLSGTNDGDEDFFGASVAISGDRIVVGAPYLDEGRAPDGGMRTVEPTWANTAYNTVQDLGTQGTGGAYLFKRQADGSWAQDFKLAASDGGSDDSFGMSVAIHGDVAIVGAPAYAELSKGNAGGGSWGDEGSFFWMAENCVGCGSGCPGSEALGRNCWACTENGVPTEGTPGYPCLRDPYMKAGAAYVFELVGDRWAERQKLEPNDGERLDSFGGYYPIQDIEGTSAQGGDGEHKLGYPGYATSIAFEGNTVIIGSAHDNDNGRKSGSAYAFARQGDGSWVQTFKFLPSDGQAFDQFSGGAVAFTGNTAFFGSPGDDEGEQQRVGSVYTFTAPPEQFLANRFGATCLSDISSIPLHASAVAGSCTMCTPETDECVVATCAIGFVAGTYSATTRECTRCSDAVDFSSTCSGVASDTVATPDCAAAFAAAVDDSAASCPEGCAFSSSHVAQCDECSGPTTAECMVATCEPGWYSYIQEGGVACADSAGDIGAGAMHTDEETCLRSIAGQNPNNCGVSRDQECQWQTLERGGRDGSWRSRCIGQCAKDVDFSTEESVRFEGCTVCSSGEVQDCTEATCSAGYDQSTYLNGTCCMAVVQQRVPSGLCGCAGGTVLNADTQVCTECGVGKTTSADLTQCVECPTGRVRSTEAECQVCAVGKIANTEQSNCEACPVGMANNTNQTRCEKCDMGHVRSYQPDCELCTAGTIQNSQQSVCEACGVGKTASANRTVCEHCPPGKVRSSAEDCELCTAGKIQNSQQSACDACGVGKTSSLNRTICEHCPPGKVRSSAEECNSCDGSGVPNDEQSTCEVCPVGKTNSRQTGGDGTTCVCQAGWYQFLPNGQRSEAEGSDEGAFSEPIVCHDADYPPSPPESPPAGCNRCDHCTECGVSNTTARVAPGYVRIFGPPAAASRRARVLQASQEMQSAPITLFKCAFKEGCHGEPVINVSSAGCKSCTDKTLPLSAGCKPLFEGHFCSTCIEGYEFQITQDPGTQDIYTCIPCQGTTKQSGLVTIAVVAVLLIMAAFRDVFIRLLTPSPARMAAFRAIIRSAANPIKILITYAQVVGELGKVLDFNAPANFKELASKLSGFLSGMDVLSSAKCLGVDTFHSKWLLQVVLIPLVMMSVPIAIFIATTILGKNKSAAVAALTSQSFFVVFFCYPRVCTYSFSTFITRSVMKNPDVNVLVSDDRQLYEDDDHLVYRTASLVVIVAFAFGVPVMAGALLFRAHRRLKPVDVALKARVSQAFQISLDEAEAAVHDITVGSSYGFLTAAFKPAYFLGESLDMLRKLLLVGLILYFERGSVAQIMIALCLALAFLCLQLRLFAYKIDHDNRMRVASELHVCLTIAVALAFCTDLDSQLGPTFGADQPDGLIIFENDRNNRKVAYDLLLVGSFIVCVPGMFVVTIVGKMSLVKQTLQASAHAAEARGDKGSQMKFLFNRFQLGLATDSESKDLAEYILTELAIDNEHARAGSRLWRDKEIVTHLDVAQMSALLEQLEEELPKSQSLGFHFTDLDSAKLILGSLGIRASTVGQLGGGVSICLATPVQLGWDKLGGFLWEKGCGDELWGSKWYEVMSGSPPADLETQIARQQVKGTWPAARDEWGSWAKKLEVCLIVRIPSPDNRDPDWIVPGRDNVFIIPPAECVFNESDQASYLSNTTIEKVLVLKPPDEACGGVAVLDALDRKNVNARVQCTSERDERGGMTEVKLSEVSLDRRIDDVLRPNPKTPWCPSVTKCTALISATVPSASRYLSRHRRIEKDGAHKQLWPEDIARFTAKEMKAAIKALVQAQLRSYDLWYHYCSTEAASRMCEKGPGLDADCTMTTLSPSDLRWEKHQGGAFRSTAGEALWGLDWERQHADDLQACLVIGLPSVVLQAQRGRAQTSLAIPEELLDQPAPAVVSASTGKAGLAEPQRSCVYSNAFVYKSYILQAADSTASSGSTANYFDQADADHTGQVTEDEAMAFLVSQGYVLSELAGFMKGFWKACDEDKNGTLDMDEFAKFMQAVTEEHFPRAGATGATGAAARPAGGGGGGLATSRTSSPRPAPAAAGGASNPLFDPSGGGGGNATAPAALDIETIFHEIDVDVSGQLETWEFTDWWRVNGGDPSQVPLFEECFELIGAEDGVAGVSLVEFKKVIGAVAANDWLEKHSAEHRRPYWWNQRTGESTWSDPGGPDRVDECVQEWLQRVGVMRLEV